MQELTLEFQTYMIPMVLDMWTTISKLYNESCLLQTDPTGAVLFVPTIPTTILPQRNMYVTCAQDCHGTTGGDLPLLPANPGRGATGGASKVSNIARLVKVKVTCSLTHASRTRANFHLLAPSTWLPCRLSLLCSHLLCILHRHMPVRGGYPTIEGTSMNSTEGKSPDTAITGSLR